MLKISLDSSSKVEEKKRNLKGGYVPLFMSSEGKDSRRGGNGLELLRSEGFHQNDLNFERGMSFID